MKTIAAVIASVMLILGFGMSQANAAVPAGNGTNNFYLTASCHAGTIGGVDFKVTNYDNGANQIYHSSWTRSGVAYSVVGIYVNGIYKGKSSDLFMYVNGHGSNIITLKMTVLGSTQGCSVKL